MNSGESWWPPLETPGVQHTLPRFFSPGQGLQAPAEVLILALSLMVVSSFLHHLWEFVDFCTQNSDTEPHSAFYYRLWGERECVNPTCPKAPLQETGC